jgi:hypothetical protein
VIRRPPAFSCRQRRGEKEKSAQARAAYHRQGRNMANFTVYLTNTYYVKEKGNFLLGGISMPRIRYYYGFEPPEIREWDDYPEWDRRCVPLAVALGVIGIAAAASCRPRSCQPLYSCSPLCSPYRCYPYVSCSPTYICYPGLA